eukprot:9475085-Lingulodinium_polyedra.AAC.1
MNACSTRRPTYVADMPRASSSFFKGRWPGGHGDSMTATAWDRTEQIADRQEHADLSNVGSNHTSRLSI